MEADSINTSAPATFVNLLVLLAYRALPSPLLLD